MNLTARRVLAATAAVAGILAAHGCTPTLPAGPARSTLVAGTHRSDTFRPAIVYSVTDGWTKTEDRDSSFRLARAPDGPFVALYRDSFPEAAACPRSTTGTGVLDSWLDNAAVRATRPTAVSVGGLSGHTFTVTHDPAADDRCAPLPPGATKTLYVLTAGTAVVIIDVTYVPGTDTVETADRFRRLAGAVVDSLAFFPTRAPEPSRG